MGSCWLAFHGPEHWFGPLCRCLSPPLSPFPFSLSMLFISLSLGSWHFISFRLLSFYWLCTILESSYSLSCICVLSFCISQEILYTVRIKRSIQWWTNVKRLGITLWNRNAPPHTHTPFLNVWILWWECMKFWKYFHDVFGKSFRKRLFVCFKWNEKSSWPFIKELRTSEFGKLIPPLLQVDWWGNWYFKIPLASKLYDCHIIEL